MRYRDLLETRYAPLYHGTSVSQMVQAIHEDKLDAWGHYISFTRDINIAKKFTRKSQATLEIWANDLDRSGKLSDEPTGEEFAEHMPLAFAEHHFVGQHGNGGAIYVFDQEKIKKQFKIKPFSDDPQVDHKWEMEERLTRDLEPLRDYILEIKLMKHCAFGSIERAVVYGDPDLGLTAHPEYSNAFDFIRSKASII